MFRRSVLNRWAYVATEVVWARDISFSRAARAALTGRNCRRQAVVNVAQLQSRGFQRARAKLCHHVAVELQKKVAAKLAQTGSGTWARVVYCSTWNSQVSMQSFWFPLNVAGGWSWSGVRATGARGVTEAASCR